MFLARDLLDMKNDWLRCAECEGAKRCASAAQTKGVIPNDVQKHLVFDWTSPANVYYDRFYRVYGLMAELAMVRCQLQQLCA